MVNKVFLISLLILTLSFSVIVKEQLKLTAKTDAESPCYTIGNPEPEPESENEWILLLRQTSGTYLTASQWMSHNTEDPNDDNYSVLSLLDDSLKGDDGQFEFKLVWPNMDSQPNYQHWKQSSNPTSEAVSGYEAVDASFTANRWGGLEYNGDTCVADGNVNHGNWFYAVGSTREWSGAIPGPATPQTVVEFYVYGGAMPEPVPEPVVEWSLLFRQTAGTYLTASQWMSLNTGDPNNDNYSILSLLDDSLRGDDGKFEFKLVWPNMTPLPNYQHWKQSSNPTSDAVSGYEAVDAAFTANGWGGLEYNGNSCLADGTVNHGNWFYAVGSKQEWGGAIPGPDTAQTVVELYVLGSMK